MNQASRRDFLKAAALATGAIGLGSALSGCSKSGGGGDISLKVAAEPYAPMPTAEEQKTSLTARAYADALQDWLQKNPGVTLSKVNIDIWNQQAMVTAAAGGTAPAIYSANALGNFNQPAILAAFKQGLAADVTKLFNDSKLVDKLAPYVRPVWEGMWQLDGKYYGVPGGFGVSDGIFYRRDLLAEAGIPEPRPEWTWTDFRAMAKKLTAGKRKGFATPQWGLQVALDSDGFSLLSQLPAPKTPWRWEWNYDWNAQQRWIPAVENWRTMMFQDKSLLSDVSYGSWNEVTAAFVRGDAAMQAGNVALYVSPADSDNSYLGLAKQVGKPVWDVVGWMTYPLGQFGEYPARRSYVDTYAFSPDLNDDELDKAFSLWTYLSGPGLVRQKEFLYNDTKDLQRVYSSDTIMPVMADTAKTLPGSPEKAWGEQYIAQVRRAGSRAAMPETSSYLPPDKAAGPTSQPVDDAMSKWMYEPGRPNVLDGLQKLQSVRNKQAESFSSTVSESDFVTGAKKYFQAQSDFWKTDAPQFHAEVFSGFLDKYVHPALGE